MDSLLTLIVFLPLAGAAMTAFLPKAYHSYAKWVAAAVTLADLVLVAVLVAGFRVDGGLQFVERFSWVPEADIQYFLGVDGISVTMLVLSALLSFLAILISWKMEKRPAAFFALLLLLEVGMNGVFVALDFVLFYVFWELVLVPMYFLIGVWGGPRRQYASLKFFLYTLLGSVFMLVGILALYLHPAGGTFDMIALAETGHGLPAGFQWWVFAAFFLGFAVKVPVFPLHTWLPDAHVEAPTAGSVILAGVLLKMGAYGFLRVSLPMLPDAAASWSWFLAALGAISVVYGAALALAQRDLKKLVAYSSVSHMGFVMLAIAAATPAALNGAVAVMFSHGVVTSMLFMLVGMVYDKTHTRMIDELGGLASKVPAYAGAFGLAAFASLGLPGLSGFVGEFLSLLGAWEVAALRGWVIVAAIGVLLVAAYTLWMVQRVILGEPSEAVARITDMDAREFSALFPLIVVIVAVGVYWSVLLRFTDPAVHDLIALITGVA